MMTWIAIAALAAVWFVLRMPGRGASGPAVALALALLLAAPRAHAEGNPSVGFGAALTLITMSGSGIGSVASLVYLGTGERPATGWSVMTYATGVLSVVGGAAFLATEGYEDFGGAALGLGLGAIGLTLAADLLGASEDRVSIAPFAHPVASGETGFGIQIVGRL